MCEFQNAVNGFGNAGARVLADNDAVHDNEKFFRDDFLFGFGEVGKRIDYAVGHGARESLRQEYGRQFVEIRALLGINPRQELQFAPLWHSRNLADNLFAALAFHGLAADRAGGPCKLREQPAQRGVAFRNAQGVRLGGGFSVTRAYGKARGQSFGAIQRDDTATA